MKLLAAAIIAAMALAGCGRQEIDAPAPSALTSKQTALADAFAWASREQGRTYTEIAATGSMRPFLDERSVALYEPYSGQPLYAGDVVYYVRASPLPPVLHRVQSVSNDAVLTSGDNVRQDGWVPKASIKFRLAGVLYSQR